MLARSCADRLYEMNVVQRRVKKGELEGGRGSPSENAALSSAKDLHSVTAVMEQIDYVVLMPDYPSTAAESLALSQYGQSVHCLFEVYQVQETNEGVAPADMKNAKEVQIGCDGEEGDDSVTHAEAIEVQISDLKAAINRSAKNAPIRNCALFRVPYCDVDPVDIKQADEGEPPATNILKAEEAFTKSFLNENLENASQLYLNFVLFQQLVELHTLMPDKAVMAEIQELKQARVTYEMMKDEREAMLKELEAQMLTEEQKEQMGEEQATEHEKAITEQIESVKAEMAEADEQQTQRQARLELLLVEAKRSLDDENKQNPKYFSDKTYKDCFLPTKESANTITSVVSAMVEQISAEKENDFDSGEQNGEDNSTEPETLDDLFDHFKEEIAYCTNLKERQPAESDFEQQSLKGKLADTFNVFETFDTSSVPIQTMPANMVDDYADYAQKMSEREKLAARNLQIPGCDRYQMPNVPQKSKRLRDIENVQFYPFSTLPIEDAERMLQLKEFANLMKQCNIYENAAGKDKQSKNKVFERKFDEFLHTDSLRSVIQKALLMNPDVATAYYPRTDQLLLMLYNKVNGAKRSSENKEKPHGFRKWKADERVMPSFQGFIDNFGPNVIQQDPNYAPQDESMPPQKLILAPDMLPHALLDVDEKRVSNISQNINQFFPDDNCILTSEEYEIGGVQRVNSIVHKDQTNFGIRVCKDKKHLPVEHQYGLVSYKPVGTHELWLNFSDKETKLHVENVEVIRNKRKMVEVLPPPKTEEELAAEAEAAAAAAAASKNKKGATEAPVEEKPPEPIWEEAPADYLDELFADSELNEVSRGPCATTTLKNGLMVRHLADGKIIQVKESMLEKQKEKGEVSRVMIPKGIIIRNFSNQDCEVLHPNGEVAYFDRAELKWTLTNAKGLRRQTQNGVSTDLDPLNCLKQTDVHTGIVTTLRADKVMLITYNNGSTYCQHADGTQIYTEVGGVEIRVEKEGFAPVTYTKMDKAEDMEEWLDVDMIRSFDSWVTDVHLPDCSHIKTVKYLKDSENTDKIITKHIYMREDFSTFMLDAEGDFRVITTSARTSINDADERARLGNDTDYLKELVRDKNTLTPGVFYGCISADENGSYITCRDSNKPFAYKINSQNKLEKLNYDKFEKNDDWMPVDLGINYDPDIELVNVNRNPHQRTFIFPRMFIISPNGEGIELLSQDQLDRDVKNAQHRQDTLTSVRVEQVETAQLNSINIMNKVSSLKENELENNKISARIKYPEYAEPYVIKMRSDDDLKKLKPRQDQYNCRNLTEYSVFDQMKQQYFIDDWTRFNEWKMSQVRYDTEFGIVHHAPKDGQIDWDEIEDNEYMAQKINSKIYKERALQREPFDRNTFRLNFESNWNKDNNVISFRKRNTTVLKEEEEIAERERQAEKQAIKAKEMAELRALEDQAAQKRQKLKEKTRARVEQRLSAFGEMKETPSFVGQYHKSRAGIKYHEENPVKPPTDEVLMRMSQRINRSQQQTDKQGVQSIFDGNSHRSGNSNERNIDQNQVNADNPIVALEPEDQFNKSHLVDKSKKFTSVSKQTGDDMDVTQMQNKPTASLYMQEKKYLKQLEQEKLLKAEEHHVIKTKDFDVYGKLRQEKPFVKSTAKSSMPSELNEKFITTECITDRRIKISSMANRQYMQAPSIEQVRKQGQHQMIMQAIEKKQTFSELINQANSMVTSVLHDNMKRAVNIMPSQAIFGGVALNSEADFTVTIKNEDSLSQRIHIKPCQDKRLVVKQETYGPIAPGMTRKVLVTVMSTEPGKLKEEVQIVTKSDVFKLKVEAEFCEQAELNERYGQASEQSVVAQELKTLADLEECLEAAGDKLVVVKFSASWCPPCQKIKPVYNEMVNAFQNSAILMQVDVDENVEATKAYGIQAMPTFKFFREGEVIHTIKGADEAAIKAKIEQLGGGKVRASQASNKKLTHSRVTQRLRASIAKGKKISLLDTVAKGPSPTVKEDPIEAPDSKDIAIEEASQQSFK